MIGPWFSIPFGVALAAYSLLQLGSTPQWWNIAITTILLLAAVASVLRGVLDLRARRRATRD
ncbi:hypothetical protein [Microbacterium trichothecenolyticum]|uniref:Uncharacterized protein n=1 Tax=Microbacterium trichothecenolyticum TaxID=69370 RepID=A0ABU0TTT4_MICTR|nr:hypothetical protein [Microbacterium trichothecenolyticum]MDQ1123067.1 hypothetical protein [Microbacterium trichothecenolyticum]